jgi:predicted ATPase
MYDTLIGRDTFLGDIMAALRDPGGRLIVGIDGMGGIGKTALAREVAERCKNERLFNSFVWIQAPKESFPLSMATRGSDL